VSIVVCALAVIGLVCTLIAAGQIIRDVRDIADRQREARERRAAKQAETVVDDALPKVLRHVEPADKIGAEIEQWLREGGRG
jgi:heme exporter protein D